MRLSLSSLLMLSLGHFGCGPIADPNPNTRQDAGTTFDCGRPLVDNLIELAPLTAVSGSSRNLEISFTTADSPVLGFDLQIYYSMDEGRSWQAYTDRRGFDYRRSGDSPQTRFLTCTAITQGTVVPLRVRFPIPMNSVRLRFAMVGVIGSAERSSIGIGGRGFTSETVRCEDASDFFECHEYTCPSGSATFHPLDDTDPTTVVCAQFIR